MPWPQGERQNAVRVSLEADRCEYCTEIVGRAMPSLALLLDEDNIEKFAAHRLPNPNAELPFRSRSTS